MSRAAELLRRIRAGGVDEIRRMIQAAYSEDLFIDYKTANTTHPARSADRFDRKNLAKALSGFGNGDGGIVLWGVVCKRTENGDVPTGEKLLPDARAFKSIIDGEMGGLTIPQHNQAESIAVLDGVGPAGFVVTYVPAGFDLPFCSVHPEARGYYVRAGSSFHEVTPGLLAGMFGRRPSAILELSAKPVLVFNPGGGFTKIAFDVLVRNIGRGMGRGIYLRVDAEHSEHVQYYISESEQWSRLNSSDHRWVLSGIESNVILPPGVQIKAFSVQYMVQKSAEKDLDVIVSAGIEGGLGAEMRLNLPAEMLWELGAAWTDHGMASSIKHVEKVTYIKIDEFQKQKGTSYIEFPKWFVGRS